MQVVAELKKKASTLTDQERWVSIVFDEMKIRQELVKLLKINMCSGLLKCYNFRISPQCHIIQSTGDNTIY